MRRSDGSGSHAYRSLERGLNCGGAMPMQPRSIAHSALAPMKNPAVAGLAGALKRYQTRRRRAKATPAKLMPSKASMPGSGTAVLC